MTSPVSRITLALLVIGTLSAVGISGCSSENIPGVYRIDIQQGNVITQEMLDQLESGMERRKVRYILGTPMLTDTFNQDRWDYYYSYSEGGSTPVRRRISVFFDGDKLARVEGDVLAGASRRPVTPRKETIVTVPPGAGDEGLFSALKPDFFGDRKKTRPEAAQPEAATPAEPAATGGDKKPAAREPDAVESASAAPVSVPVPSAGDKAYLEQLFEGFGKAGTPGAGGPDRAGSTAGSEGEEFGVAATADSQNNDAEPETEGGFIRRLIDRLRRSSETESSDATAPSDTAPLPAPQPAAP